MVDILELHRTVKLLVFWSLICLVALSTVEARIRHYKWEVKYEYKSPDCFQKLVTTINGGTPGPTILAQQGDTIVVELKNSLLTENIAIHWHGIRQIGTPWSDGTEGVTQCPILPGDTFKYKFIVDRAGTFLYHGHYGMQREAGLYGSIIVSLPDGVSEPFAYDNERSIILNDWFHKSTYEEATGLSSIPFVWVGEPQSLLINGRGRYNCSLLSNPSLEACNVTNPECSPYILTVIPGKTYRLRIGSLTSLSALSFQIEGHNFTVVEADGHYVEPFVTKNLYIYSGETYSILVKANQNPSRNYWMTSNVVGRKPGTPTGLAILNYYPTHFRKSPPTVPTTGPLWNDTAPRLAQSLAIKALQSSIHTPPLTSDKTIVLLNTQNKIDGVAKNVNATSSNGLYRLKFNSTVDVVLQNANTMSVNNSETHPWHLHGHDFWVLGYGTGKFDVTKDVGKYNLANPIMKNTVPVHPYGWTALRFRADNPGVWAFHCHIESHFYMGMGVVFESGVEKVGMLPSSVMGCGETKGFHRP
ncbi:hypothetical protein M0R45_014185 [Rubus argutus]|uniref:L-ascorbate oxidase n=1 Tax=Rubus argutus TaxID=59490 RepID=A0AAW1XM66_RUBAR